MEAATVAALGADRARARASARAVPWLLYAVLFGSTSIVVGLIWDVSWHMTIGRDTLWTPAHLATYLGGVVAGVACGARVLRTFFTRDAEAAAQGVRFWRWFHGSLGGWVCIWGTFAMLTSAPFDDWWHNAYGLDVKILSPPHALLGLGMISVALGAMLMVLARQNRSERADGSGGFRVAYAYAGGLVLIYIAIMTSEYSYWLYQHSAIFYKVICGAFPLVLVAIARGSKLRWPATSVAAVYMAVMIVMGWVLPLFPAQPGLGPIYQNVTHMVPMDFPLLIVFPALAMDVVAHRLDGRVGGWTLAAAMGLAFWATLVAVHWPWAYFLQSKYSMNWAFFTDNYFYGLPKTSRMYRRLFVDVEQTAQAFWTGMLLWAPLFAVLSTRLGLAWGNWMRGVRR
jgi:hypothetical protein